MHTYFVKMDQRMHDTLYMCIYSSGLGAFAAWAPGAPAPGKGSRAAKAPSPLEYIHMYGVSCMRWSILANAPIHFGECACPFYRMRQSILANILFHSMLLHHSGIILGSMFLDQHADQEQYLEMFLVGPD